MVSAGKSARICLGVIAGARGVRGEMRFRSYGDEPRDLSQYGALETQEGHQFAIERVSVKGGQVSLSVHGVTSREEAEALKGTKLYMLRAALPETERDEFYHADLVGLVVKDKGGRQMGRVVAVQNFGAGDLLEVLPDGEGKVDASFFAPFSLEVVPVIDLEGGWLTLDPPPGLIEELTEEEQK